jgi:hypothetical protein
MGLLGAANIIPKPLHALKDEIPRRGKTTLLAIRNSKLIVQGSANFTIDGSVDRRLDRLLCRPRHSCGWQENQREKREDQNDSFHKSPNEKKELKRIKNRRLINKDFDIATVSI